MISIDGRLVAEKYLAMYVVVCHETDIKLCAEIPSFHGYWI